MDYNIHDYMIINQSFNDINPLVAGWQACSSGYSFGPASRTYHLLHYVLSGKGSFTNSTGKHTVDSGQIFIINPFEITSYSADEKNPWTYCWVGFICNIDMPEILKNPVIDARNCEHIFISIKNMENVEHGRELLICSKIYELFSILIKHGKENSNSKNHSLEYVLKAKNYIDTKYADEISIEQLSGYLGIERSYFSHIFKKYVGVSPQKYLVDLRLTKAAELISSYHYTVSEAALSTGYSDIVNFSRMFKRRFGVCPSMYYDSSKMNNI